MSNWYDIEHAAIGVIRYIGETLTYGNGDKIAGNSRYRVFVYRNPWLNEGYGAMPICVMVMVGDRGRTLKYRDEDDLAADWGDRGVEAWRSIR